MLEVTIRAGLKGASVKSLLLARLCASNRIRSGTIALAYAAILLIWGGASFSRLYGPSPYHSLQAEAILKGHLYLDSPPLAIQQNLVLQNGKVQQVWGLGVGLFLTPFQFVFNLLGLPMFPDRIAMGLAFGLFAFYSSMLSFDLAKTFGKITGIGVSGIILLHPTVLTLTNGRHLIYEDTILYAATTSMAILVAMIRFAVLNRLSDFYICAILASISGSVRATHAIYGFAGMVACCFLLLLQRNRRTHLFLGMGIFILGLIFLTITNSLRFGSPFEFGHRLTATTGPMVYLTRFQNPFKATPTLDANKELVAALFFSRPNGHLQSQESTESDEAYTALTDKVIPGQASFPRWRDMYTSSYDCFYLAIVTAGAIIGIILVSRNRSLEYASRPMDSHCGRWLLVWFSLSSSVLWGFYLYFPTISSRYLLDFGPAFSAMIVLVFTQAAKHAPKASIAILIVWLGFEAISARSGSPQYPILSYREISKDHTSIASISPFHGKYTIDTHPILSEVNLNGEGWNNITGLAGPVVLLVVDQPRFVDLIATTRLNEGKAPPIPDRFRAQIANTELILESVQKTNNLVHVHFRVPARLTNDTQILSLCFIDSADKVNLTSRRLLETVSWR